MAVRIRVYPQNGMLGMNGMGMGMQGGAVSAATYFNSKLNTQKQVSSLQLGYERALANEKIERVRLEERLKNPYMAAQGGIAGAYGGMPLGLPMGMGMGLPMGMGMPMGMPMGAQMAGGIPAGFAGSGQSNVTNQSSTGGNQSVTNSNVNHVNHSVRHPMMQGGWGGYPGTQFGGGGFLSGLLGALI